MADADVRDLMILEESARRELLDPVAFVGAINANTDLFGATTEYVSFGEIGLVVFALAHLVTV